MANKLPTPTWLSTLVSVVSGAFCLERRTVFLCAKGKAKNKFNLKLRRRAFVFEPDGQGRARVPPTPRGYPEQPACDWCVLEVPDERIRETCGIYVELKGSNYKHALEQLSSTIRYLKNQYRVRPIYAAVVISGAHPKNAKPGKDGAKLNFKREFKGVVLEEKRSGAEVDLARLRLA